MAVRSQPLYDARAFGNQRHVHWISLLLTAMLYGAALLALALLVQRGLLWGQRRYDDLRYGFPRSAQVRASVGFGDSATTPTHIVTLNIDGQVSTLVLPAGDSARLAVLAGPYLVGDDGPYSVPLPRLLDVNRDGAVDLLVTVRGEDVVYLNRGNTFTLMTTEERAHMLEELHGQ